MRANHVLQIAVGCLAAGTPWLVARIALAVASRPNTPIGTSFPVLRSMQTLARATLAALPLVAVAGWLLPPPSLLMGGVDVVAFAALSAFGVRALAEIEAASRPGRDLDVVERTASLRPRRLNQYLPAGWHALPFVAATIALGLLAWRLPSLSSNRILVPLSFILATPVFLWLYEVWMRSEISGEGSVEPDETRRQRVRWIFAAETILVAGLAGIGHALLDVDWTAPGVGVVLGTAAGALLGVAGCALALSSELSRRRYRVPPSAIG